MVNDKNSKVKDKARIRLARVPKFDKDVEADFRQVLPLDVRQNIMQITKFIGNYKFVDRNMIFNFIPNMKLKFIKDAAHKSYIVEYYSVSSGTWFYALDVKGYYLLSRASYFVDELPLNSTDSMLKDIYRKNCDTMVYTPNENIKNSDFSDLVVVQSMSHEKELMEQSRKILK